MAICILGDIHFRDDKPYFVETCEKFLDWFNNDSFNNKDNDLILLGDLVERPTLSGRVAEFLERFYNYSKFRSIHIVVGNHDLKRHFGVEQLAYEFYKDKPFVHIYEKITEVEIDNHSFLMLPHFNGEDIDGFNMKESYSNLYKNPRYNKHYDFALGHFCCDDMPFAGSEAISNLESMDIGKLVLGHIHTRNINPGRYLGSVFANKKSENDYNRAMLVIDGNSVQEYKLPIFNEFIDITYPNKTINVKSLVQIYTIYNCASESIARDYYGKDIFIKMVTKNESDIKKQDDTVYATDFTKVVDIKSSFDEYSKMVNLNPEVDKECRNALNI